LYLHILLVLEIQLIDRVDLPSPHEIENVELQCKHGLRDKSTVMLFHGLVFLSFALGLLHQFAHFKDFFFCELSITIRLYELTQRNFLQISFGVYSLSKTNHHEVIRYAESIH